MAARGIFTVMAATATAGAAYFAFMPTSTEVPGSLVESVIEAVDVAVGPLSIDYDPERERVGCGSPMAPAEFRLQRSGPLPDLFGSAERALNQIENSCEQAHQRRWQLVVVSLIAAGTLLGLGLVSRPRRTPKPAPPSVSPSPDPTWPVPNPRPSAAPSGPPTGPPLVPPRTFAPVTAGPIPPAGASGSASVEGSRRRRQMVAAGAGGVVAMIGAVGVFGVSGVDRDVARVALPGLPTPTETTIDPALLAARECATAAFDSIDDEYELSRRASTADLEGSSLNLDGDASWTLYSDVLRQLDVYGCTAEFRSAVVELSNAWRAFGDDWNSSTKRLKFDPLSDQDRDLHMIRINAAMQSLQDLASDIDLDVRSVTYSFG